MDPEWRFVNFPIVKNGGYSCVMMVYQSAFSLIFSNKNRFLGPPGSVFRQAHAVEAATGRGLPWRVVDGAWGSGIDCVIWWFLEDHILWSLWVEYLQFPWKGVDFLFFFFSGGSSFYPKNTVFVREILKKKHFILCNIRSTKDEEKTLQSYSVITQIWSMLWVWC